MPEGDVLFRTAATIRRWLAGREVTAATTRAPGMPAGRLVGQRVVAVEARGKHLLVRFASGDVLHTHLRMSGSWHVYSEGDRWRRPGDQARLVLTCGDRLAVCFNAPVVELLRPDGEKRHPALAGLGPDILAEEFDVEEARRRTRSQPADLALGELLLDQRVVAGIGNIWRCESLFLERRHPWAPQDSVTDEELDALLATARRLMQASAGDNQRVPRWVYRRQGRPCRRCGTLVAARGQGEQARTAYWCPTCQPPPPPPPPPSGDALRASGPAKRHQNGGGGA
ncbi:MAG TPA: DNA-formamidopyrimidine glycosylase family protein [Acidimicrobiales bacterium]|nr:DNA-formamidopyrimidine glycosylase family protein [Acidimicrobiales bacterium]